MGPLYCLYTGPLLDPLQKRPECGGLLTTPVLLSNLGLLSNLEGPWHGPSLLSVYWSTPRAATEKAGMWGPINYPCCYLVTPCYLVTWRGPGMGPLYCLYTGDL
jgi:hypothetical protein